MNFGDNGTDLGEDPVFGGRSDNEDNEDVM